MSRKRPKHIPRPGLDQYGRTLLHYASADGHVERVRQLIAAGSIPTVQDDDGWSPLHFAVQGRHTAVIDLLLESGADPNAVDSHGNGPLWIATLDPRSDSKIIARLVRAGADPRRKNIHGRSPHDMALTIGNGLETAFSDA